jgi:hypothetical protein
VIEPPEFTVGVTTIVSAAAPLVAIDVRVIATFVTTPATTVTEVFAGAMGVAPAAREGATDNRPKPNADTATSAMRLIDVFVDICFLSVKVDLKDFLRSAWRENAFSSDMSEPFLSVA